MKPSEITEDEMILHLYGESADGAAIDRAIAADPELASRFEMLRRELDRIPPLDVPEPAPDLANRVWEAIRPQLEPHRGSWWQRLLRGFDAAGVRPGLALAAACALLVAAGIGFFLGRTGRPAATSMEADLPALSQEARDRLLLAALSDHLDGSERLFTSIANAPDSADATLLRDKSRWAASLAVSNRLYRRAAERSGQRRIVALLDELEPLLVELANAAPDPDAAADEIATTQQRLEEKDLLFKLRVAGGRLERPIAARANSTNRSI